MIDPLLENRCAIVTGANHGIGAATAMALARCGAKVYVTYLRRPLPSSTERTVSDTPGRTFYQLQQARDGQEIVRQIIADGGLAAGAELDLRPPESVPKLFDEAERAFGPVDILVNNAAHCVADTFIPTSQGAEKNIAGHDVIQFSAESFDDHAVVNLRAVGMLMAEFARRHTQRRAAWGRIVNVSTDASATFPSEVSYGATKYATESLSRSAACELGRFGITVNVVAPGPTQTGYISPEAEALLLPKIPLGRLGTPDDVADVIVFLGSEQARWLTGQVLYASGGKTM